LFYEGFSEVVATEKPREFWDGESSPYHWQNKFMARCFQEFDENFCQYADAQIQREGGYNPWRWAEYASEKHCSWGMWQNYVCDDFGWTKDQAEYIYYVLTNAAGFHVDEYERLKKFEYLLDGNWQIEELLRRYKNRIDLVSYYGCAPRKIEGEIIHGDIYCALRLHNWNAGDDYVSLVVSKKQELYK
jgi:hypothetical protein